jgi:hypothetical protein
VEPSNRPSSRVLSVALIVAFSTGECPEVSASWPAATKPELQQVYAAAEPPRIVTPVRGVFPVLPARSVILEVGTPYPADIEVALADEPLENTKSPQREAELDELDLGYFQSYVPADAITTGAASWRLTISPPVSKRPSGRFRLDIRMLSLNPDLTGESRRSRPLSLTIVDSWAVGTPALTQVSSDPFSGDGAQHATQVEVDTFSYGSDIVAVMQSGRFENGGGASGTSFATSNDAGLTWTSGELPNLTTLTGGDAERATDPNVAYDPRHDVWLAASLRLRGPFTSTGGSGPSDYAVSRSTDGGFTWSDPVVAVDPVKQLTPKGDYFGQDKGWIVCDTYSSSPFYGRCYLAYADFSQAPVTISIVRSDDGGRTWKKPVVSADNAGGTLVQPVVQPDGTIVIPYVVFSDIRSIRSTDGGVTFEASVRVATAVTARAALRLERRIRDVSAPSAEVASSGRVFLAWSDCEFQGCSPGSIPPGVENDIVYTSSEDGVLWEEKRRIQISGEGPEVDHLTLGLAVDPSDAVGHLAITYYFLVDGDCDANSCQLNVGFVHSANGGASWSDRTVLNDRPMKLPWLSRTPLGAFVGDYISTSFVGAESTVSVFPLAEGAPVSGLFSQHAWAALVGVA